MTQKLNIGDTVQITDSSFALMKENGEKQWKPFYSGIHLRRRYNQFKIVEFGKFQRQNYSWDNKTLEPPNDTKITGQGITVIIRKQYLERI